MKRAGKQPFRAQRSAASLKPAEPANVNAVRRTFRAQRSAASLKRRIEAGLSRCEDVAFRAQRSAASLKRSSVFVCWGRVGAFRAQRSAASLKQLL